MPSLQASTSKPLLVLRRTPTDLESRGTNRMSSVRCHREASAPKICAWTGQAAPWKQPRESQPGSKHAHCGPTDTHFKIAARLRLVVTLCAHETRCACAPTTTGATCGPSIEPLTHHTVLCSRANMSWRHDVIAVASHMPRRRLLSPPESKKLPSSHQENTDGSPTSTAEASRVISRCTWTWW